MRLGFSAEKVLARETPPPFLNGVCDIDFAIFRRSVANQSPVIAFIFTGYILSFVVDLLPSVRTRRRVPQGEKRTEMGMSNAPPVAQPDITLEEPVTTDSAGPNANYYRGARV